MKSKLPYTDLWTSRLHLRKVKIEDTPQIFILRTDKTVNKYIRRVTQKNLDQAKLFVQGIIDDTVDRKVLYWVITIKDEFIGTICLWNISERGKYGEVGYELLPAFHSIGIMSEALDAVINFAFEYDFETIEAYTHRKNTASRKMLEKRGFELVPEEKDDDNPNNIIYRIGANA